MARALQRGGFRPTKPSILGYLRPILGDSISPCTERVSAGGVRL